MLKELFAWQGELNRKVGHDTERYRHDFDPKAAGEMLVNYIDASSSELEELRDCTYWKHLCAEAKQGRRFEIHNLQNARVEVVDLLFFWISMAQCVGLGAEEVFELYRQKLQVNRQRQDTGYSMQNKTEDDNKHIELPGEARA